MPFSCKGHLVSLLGLPSNTFTSVYPVPYLLGASSTPQYPEFQLQNMPQLSKSSTNVNPLALHFSRSDTVPAP